ncbi:hypothetical protein BLNAU_18832 [Blattamonas nauphoetae]|uniref:Uncharacterized protein n=1 Tax=Blattamonas nauphoetae TaxID=2049346 RepID=A0ABQ9X3G3_9EUKA|nr:hypothetical protein BLNAU_18832 [Blattamonas nauphoetae]
MATVHSYNTPIALLIELRKLADIIFRTDPLSPNFGRQTTGASQHRFIPHNRRLTDDVAHSPKKISPFEQSITEKLRTAEGEERWKLLTQMVVVSSEVPEITNELMNVENDAQALLIFSVPKIRSVTHLNLHLHKNLAAFDRVVELAGHINNLPLVAAAMTHIANTVQIFFSYAFSQTRLILEQRQSLRELVFNTLRAIAPLRREGVEEGWVVGKDEVTSQIVDSCLKVMQKLISDESFDPTPAIDSLISLAVTTDLSLLRSILVILEEIEERTRNTPTPFSISRATAPFRGIHESSVTQQPLPSIVSSILLSALLDSHSSSGITRTPPLKDDSISPFKLLSWLSANLRSVINTNMMEIVCLILAKRRTSSSRPLTSLDPFGIRLSRREIQVTPQQLFLSLCTIILPEDSAKISASTLLPLAPFLTRILTIVVPSSPDRVEIRSDEDEHSQLLNIFLSLVLSLIDTGTPSSLSTPPLSSLLSVLSIALVRLDTIPSLLRCCISFHYKFRVSENRSDPQMRQVVLALSEEGMEDRSNVAYDSFSKSFLDIWKGANADLLDY